MTLHAHQIQAIRIVTKPRIATHHCTLTVLHTQTHTYTLSDDLDGVLGRPSTNTLVVVWCIILK